MNKMGRPKGNPCKGCRYNAYAKRESAFDRGAHYCSRFRFVVTTAAERRIYCGGKYYEAAEEEK